MLLGWMSARVLGQYDMLVVDEPAEARRPGRRVLRRPERPRPREAVRLPAPRVPARGSRSTRSPTGRSSPACRGCASTTSGWSRQTPRLGRPRPEAAPRRRSAGVVEEVRKGRSALADGGLATLFASPAAADRARQDRRADEPARGPRRHHDGPRRRRPGAERRPLRPGAARAPGQRLARGQGAAAPDRPRGQDQPVRAGRAVHRGGRAARRRSRRARAGVAAAPSWLPTLAEIREPEEWLSRVRLADELVG